MSWTLLAMRLQLEPQLGSGKDKRTRDCGNRGLDHQDLPLNRSVRSCNGVSRFADNRLEWRPLSMPTRLEQRNSKRAH